MAGLDGAWPIGFRINPRVEGPSDEWLARFKDIPVAYVSDCLGHSVGTMGLNIYHGDLSQIMVGRALTVRVRPGDNLMLHKALETARPNDVLVVDSGGDVSQALIGGNILATATQKGLAGIVIDGAVRDIAEIHAGRMPVWARGHTHRGPNKDGPGEINVPIAVGGMPVLPGDLVLGDADGVVAVSVADLDVLWPRVQKQAEKEVQLRHAAETGTNYPERFNSILRAKGCPV